MVKVQPVRVQAKDKNGISVETTYTPLIAVTPTATPATSENIQEPYKQSIPTFVQVMQLHQLNKVQ